MYLSVHATKHHHFSADLSGPGGILVQAWGPLGSGSLGISASSACEAGGKSQMGRRRKWGTSRGNSPVMTKII